MPEKNQIDTPIALISKVSLGSDIWQFEFEKPASYHHMAGQYNEYHLPVGDSEDDNRRWFTNSAAPVEDVIRISTRINHTSSAFKQKLASMSATDTIKMKGPMGDFVLPKDKTEPVLLIAGGIGITPYRSMIKQLLSTSERRAITLIYAAHTPKDLVFSELFDEAERSFGGDFRTIKVVDQPDDRWGGLTGQITDQMISDASQTPISTTVYVSGPEPMVDAFKPRLTKLGFVEAKIRQDWFPGYVDQY